MQTRKKGMTPRELAIVLHALRAYQEGNAGVRPFSYACIMGACDHFADLKDNNGLPTNAEIDRLCEKLNTGGC